MEAILKHVKPLPDYKLELEFQNGSTAVVNMAGCIHSIRFFRIARKEVFATARAQGDKVIWVDGLTTFGVYCSELLDTMMMD